MAGVDSLSPEQYTEASSASQPKFRLPNFLLGAAGEQGKGKGNEFRVSIVSLVLAA